MNKCILFDEKKSITGYQGFQGDKGYKGETSNEIGYRGEEGFQGEDGDEGPNGEDWIIINTHNSTVYKFALFSEDAPSTPNIGSGFYDFETNELTPPDGWSSDSDSIDGADNEKGFYYSSVRMFYSDGRITPWSKPFPLNGKPGEDSKGSEYIYLRSDKNDTDFMNKLKESVKYKNGTGKNIDKFVPTHTLSWQNHNPGIGGGEGEKYVYMSYRVKVLSTIVDGKEINEWGDFSDPILKDCWGKDGDDGDGFEIIYKLFEDNDLSKALGKAKSELDTERLNDKYGEDAVQEVNGTEFIPESDGWHDNQLTQNNPNTPTQVAARRNYNYSTNKWGDYEVSIWNVYMSDGHKGIKINIKGVYTDFEAFTNEIVKNVGTTVKPDEFDSYVVEGVIWVFINNEFQNYGDFSFKGSSYFAHEKFAKDISKLKDNDPYTFGWTANSGEDTENALYRGYYVDYKENDSIYPYREKDGSLTYNWKYFGGEDGLGYELIFTRKSTIDKPDTPLTLKDEDSTILTSIDNLFAKSSAFTAQDNTVWTDDEQGTDSTLLYEFYCKRTGKNGEWSEFGEVKLRNVFNKDAVKGEVGKDGLILYPGGIWNKGTNYKITERTEKDGSKKAIASPYVLDITTNKYYYLLKNFTGDTDPLLNITPSVNYNTGNKMWQEIETKDSVFCKNMLANSASVGKAYFYNGYILSEEGETYTGNYTKNYQNFSKFHLDPYFDYVKPVDEDKENTFKPNWCVDLKNGKMYCNCGLIRLGVDDDSFLALDKDGNKMAYIDDSGEFACVGNPLNKVFTIGNGSDYKDGAYFIPVPCEVDVDGEGHFTLHSFNMLDENDEINDSENLKKFLSEVYPEKYNDGYDFKLSGYSISDIDNKKLRSNQSYFDLLCDTNTILYDSEFDIDDNLTTTGIHFKDNFIHKLYKDNVDSTYSCFNIQYLNSTIKIKWINDKLFVKNKYTLERDTPFNEYTKSTQKHTIVFPYYISTITGSTDIEPNGFHRDCDVDYTRIDISTKNDFLFTPMCNNKTYSYITLDTLKSCENSEVIIENNTNFEIFLENVSYVNITDLDMGDYDNDYKIDDIFNVIEYSMLNENGWYKIISETYLTYNEKKYGNYKYSIKLNRNDKVFKPQQGYIKKNEIDSQEIIFLFHKPLDGTVLKPNEKCVLRVVKEMGHENTSIYFDCIKKYENTNLSNDDFEVNFSY